MTPINEDGQLDAGRAAMIHNGIHRCPDGPSGKENIIKQNFQEAQKKVQQLQKLAQECYVRKQQLGVLFDDIRHVVSRYYKIAEPIPTPNTNPQA